MICKCGPQKEQAEYQYNQAESEGVVSWLIKRGKMLFGYIESTCGREIYFDTSSFIRPECDDISIGDKVKFVVIKIDLGDVALRVRKIEDEAG